MSKNVLHTKQMYDKIIATSKSEETKANAEANKKIALEAAYAN